MKTILTLITILLFTQSYSQLRSYAFVLLGDTVGKSYVHRKDSAGYLITSLSASSRAKIMGIEKKADVKMYQIKKHGILQYSYFRNLSESEEIVITTVLKGDTTFIYKNDALVKKTGKIIHTVLDLYFSPPTHHRQVYAERLMTTAAIIHDTDGSYYFKPESGQTNSYYYNKQGILTLCKIKKGFGTMYFVLR